MNREIKNISIVVPVYNEEINSALLYNEIYTQCVSLNYDFEIIFVDDGSKDKTYQALESLILNEGAQKMKIISLSRNFGHQIALTAGLENCSGDVIIMMDGDLQHPPALIPTLIEKYTQGFDVVNTKRISSEDVSVLKKLTSSVFYTFFNSLSDFPIESASADFRLLSRQALNSFLQLKEKDRFIRGMIGWIGYNQTSIEYKANKRHAGISKYTFKKMLLFSLNGITSFSSKPLRISFVLGLLVLFISIIYMFFAFYIWLKGNTVQGWTSILFCVLFLGSIQLISVGIIGEYLARVYNEIKNRPLYIVKQKVSSK